MKKLYLFSAFFLSFCLFAACFAPLVETGERVSEDVFRLHILANSDSARSISCSVRGTACGTMCCRRALSSPTASR